MTKLRYILLFVIAAAFVGCNEDETIVAAIGPDKYQLKDDASDPVEKFRYHFYTDTKTVILFSADTTDYRWNYRGNNVLKLHWGQKANYQVALEMLDDYFFSKFPRSFFLENFPQSIFLCNDIEEKPEDWMDYESTNVAFTNQIAAIAAVKDDITEWTDEQKEEFGVEVITKYMAGYMVDKGALKIPDAFYEVSQDSYRQMADLSVDPMTLGFVEYQDYWGMKITQTRDEDYPRFVKFLFTHTQAEINEVITKYPKMATKIAILREMFSDQINLEL
ncbi:MAG: hypothetical protein N4A71_06065 [Carboxylicivirga sp.]|jgi:hypothetical protein|nr:hypothetical protein [Carboxylicivirga sp.]